MKFQPGQSGNPAGRPKGKKVAEYRAMLETELPAILRVVVGKAHQGDLIAARIILDRVYPVRDAAMSDLLDEFDELRAAVADLRERESR